MLPSERHDPDSATGAGGWVTTRCARALVRADGRVAAGVVGAADPPRAAPLLRLLAVWQRDGSQGAAGAFGPRVAVDHDPATSTSAATTSSRRGRTPTGAWRPGSVKEVTRCNGTCG